MLCPFRKSVQYRVGNLYTDAVAGEWSSVEYFEDCVGEDCVAFEYETSFSFDENDNYKEREGEDRKWGCKLCK